METTDPTPNAAPPPYRPPMSWEERARRAEALGDNLACAAHALPGSRFDLERLRAALDRWEAHKADLATLDQQEPRPCPPDDYERGLTQDEAAACPSCGRQDEAEHTYDGDGYPIIECSCRNCGEHWTAQADTWNRLKTDA